MPFLQFYFIVIMLSHRTCNHSTRGHEFFALVSYRRRCLSGVVLLLGMLILISSLFLENNTFMSSNIVRIARWTSEYPTPAPASAIFSTSIATGSSGSPTAARCWLHRSLNNSLSWAHPEQCYLGGGASCSGCNGAAALYTGGETRSRTPTLRSARHGCGAQAGYPWAWW